MSKPVSSACRRVLFCLLEVTGATSLALPSLCHNARPRCPPGYHLAPFAILRASRGRRRARGEPGGAPPRGAGDAPSCAPERCAAHGHPRALRAYSILRTWPGLHVLRSSFSPFLDRSIIPRSRVLAHAESSWFQALGRWGSCANFARYVGHPDALISAVHAAIAAGKRSAAAERSDSLVLSRCYSLRWVASALSRRLTLRAALFGWIMPLVAALSYSLWDSSRIRRASSSSPESTAL